MLRYEIVSAIGGLVFVAKQTVGRLTCKPIESDGKTSSGGGGNRLKTVLPRHRLNRISYIVHTIHTYNNV